MGPRTRPEPTARVEELRGYGLAESDTIATWPAALRARIRRASRSIILDHLAFGQKIRFLFAFLAARRRSRNLDLSDLQARGLTAGRFLDQQLEYLAMFAALSDVLGEKRAVEITREVIQQTAREPMLLCLPEPEDVRRCGEPFDVMQTLLRSMQVRSAATGCHRFVIIAPTETTFGYDVHWCVFLELARLMGVPAGCLGSCHGDEVAFPEYFAALGMRYQRTGTLAGGASHCDFRFTRIDPVTAQRSPSLGIVGPEGAHARDRLQSGRREEVRQAGDRDRGGDDGRSG